MAWISHGPSVGLFPLVSQADVSLIADIQDKGIVALNSDHINWTVFPLETDLGTPVLFM